ncbi:NACHT domain-containing protein [Nostoc sp.]|uniref:NACHT domain-containing protein n=1 Tax=Nostoc sp. TaxID=1180 RepID=UPI002FF17EE5
MCVALREQGKERIRDLVKNPLRLTLLCFNWHLGEGNLPQTKAGLYEQFVADFYEWKKERFATTREQRRRLKKALGEMAREAIDKEAMRFRLRQEFVCEYLGEPDDTDSLFTLALRLGWLNKVGVEADNLRREVYAFFHPTFQEYFAASAINDWHYFLNHIPENPIHPNANYRVFDLQWRDVLFIWIGFLKNNYIEVIDALVSFEDRCKSWNNNLKTFYEHQAYIIALYCLMEISIDKTFKYITKQLAIYIYNVCGEKERHNYWSFLSNDIFLVLEQLYKKHILQELFNLAASEINNVKIISELKKIVFVCKDITLRNHDQLILERQDILNIVAEIDKLIRTSEAGESVYYRISQYIELIEKNNLILINKLILILNEANPRHIKLKAIRALSLAADENLDAITAINQEIENSPDIIYLFYTTITLIQINLSNTEAFLSLYKLLPQLHIYMQMEACEFLIKNKGIVDYLFIDLIELIEKHPNDEVYYRACQALKNNVNVLHIGYSLLLISKLKNCLTDKVYKHNFFRYRDCYELLWYFSQKVPYKLFCEAWLK